ncbi:MAG: NAD-dependent epimerase/dehydratase family protein [Bacteroidetes bacterium]|nr:NAD-dependent epimerase/dehydratase family protein [Bacteroidota bacterium]
MKEQRILITGACGQIGTELIPALRQRFGDDHVIATDIHVRPSGISNYIQLDVMQDEMLELVVKECGVTQIYHLAAMLSAKGEQNLDAAWSLNVHSLLSILKIAHEQGLEKVFWPSSIAVFGPNSPKYNCHQNARTEPTTVYGISKRAGEYWCNYYFDKFGVDVRSLRYPGLISAGASPGGGTTDYAVDIFHQALEKGNYTCYLEEDTCLPMMYMPDAIRATLELMEAPKEKISVRTSYNLAAMSFAPCDLAARIRKILPDFKIDYHPDFRQAIANSWPASIRDTEARRDWGWQPEFDLNRMTLDMLERLSVKKCLPLPEQEAETLTYPDFPMDNYVASNCRV